MHFLYISIKLTPSLTFSPATTILDVFKCSQEHRNYGSWLQSSAYSMKVYFWSCMLSHPTGQTVSGPNWSFTEARELPLCSPCLPEKPFSKYQCHSWQVQDGLQGSWLDMLALILDNVFSENGPSAASKYFFVCRTFRRFSPNQITFILIAHLLYLLRQDHI